MILSLVFLLQKRRRSLQHPHLEVAKQPTRAHPARKHKVVCSTREASPITTLHMVKRNHPLYRSSISFVIAKNHHHRQHCPPFLRGKSNPIHSNPTHIASPPKNYVTTNVSKQTYMINSVMPPRFIVKYVTTPNHSSSLALNW